MYGIRAAKQEDLEHVGAIEIAAATLFPPGTIPESKRRETVPIENLGAASREGRLWVAVSGEEERPVGFFLIDDVSGCAVLAEVDVLPRHGRRGVGRKLVSRAIEEVRRGGHAALYLTTFAHLPWNAPFYAKLGFGIVAEKDLPPPIVAMLRSERAEGLANRVAMRLDLR